MLAIQVLALDMYKKCIIVYPINCTPLLLIGSPMFVQMAKQVYTRQH
jgi:hypothetical protein